MKKWIAAILLLALAGCIQPSENGKVSDYKDFGERIKLLEPIFGRQEILRKDFGGGKID